MRWHPEGPGHDQGLALQGSHEIQQGQVQGPASEGSNPQCEKCPGDGGMESSRGGEGLVMLLGKKLDMPWPCELGT